LNFNTWVLLDIGEQLHGRCRGYFKISIENEIKIKTHKGNPPLWFFSHRGFISYACISAPFLKEKRT
jgi:hypothetical protein